jgi:hypothetical protein
MENVEVNGFHHQSHLGYRSRVRKIFALDHRPPKKSSRPERTTRSLTMRQSNSKIQPTSAYTPLEHNKVASPQIPLPGGEVR